MILELNLKIIITIIFIFIYFNWIILKLKIFYDNNLKIKNNIYSLWKHVLSVPPNYKVHKFILKLF